MKETQLSDHIKTIFETFEDAGAEQGWVALREKYPAQQKRSTLIWWLSGIAASLLFITCMLWLKPGSDKHPTKHAIVSHHNKTATSPLTTSRKSQQKPVYTNSIPGNPDHTKMIALDKSASGTLAVITPPFLVPETTAVTPQVSLKQDTASQTAHIAAMLPDTLKKRSFEDFLNEETKANTTNKVAHGKASSLKGTNFELYSATFLNYDANNEAKINLGLGVNAHIPISSRLYLSVGAGISENQLNYKDKIPSSLFSTMQSIGLQNGTPIKNLQINARILNMDFPLAIKFYPTKSKKFYITSGINSSGYLNQQYEQSYQTVGPPTGNSNNIKQTTTFRFKGFDFASSALFAVGIHQSLGKSTRITFEPFFKPALNGYGVNSLRINTAGLNLKLNLGKQK